MNKKHISFQIRKNDIVTKNKMTKEYARKRKVDKQRERKDRKRE